MECWMLWHGGASYAVPEIPRDLEHFDSLRAARDAFWRYGDHDPYRPCVIEDTQENGGATAWIFFYDPSGRTCHACGAELYVNKPGGEVEPICFECGRVNPPPPTDPYPDRILNYGPRGGVRLEYA